MNNYCTNCGVKLKPYTVVCSSCNTPVVDIPFEHRHVTPKNKKIKKTVLYTFLIIGSIIVTFFALRRVYINYMSDRLEHEMVIPFLQERFGNSYSDLEFDMYGKCIISGNCYTEPLISCDGNGCEVYTYLNRFKCMSFFYTYEIGDEEYSVTVFKDSGEFKIVNGRNIYGYDDIFSDDYLNYEDEEIINHNFFIKEDAYESDYISLNREFEHTYYYQDKTQIDLDFYESLYMNSYYKEINSFIRIKTFNKYYEELGEIEVSYSDEYNKYYIDSFELANDVEYIKLYIGEVYE